jgi:hypothetical protein
MRRRTHLCKPFASYGCGSSGSGLGNVVLAAALAAILSAAAALIEDILTAASGLLSRETIASPILHLGRCP